MKWLDRESGRQTTVETDRLIEGDGSPVWEEATEGRRGEVCVDESVRQGGLENSCSVSPWCRMRVRNDSQLASSDLRSPLHSVTQWLLNAAFRPVQLYLRMNHLTSAFYFWRGSRFYAAVFPLQREHWSALRPHTRAAVGLIRPSGELLF